MAPNKIPSFLIGIFLFAFNSVFCQNWSEVAVFYPSLDEIKNDYFGREMAVSGNTLVIGASGNDSLATDFGLAYVFEKELDNWVMKAKLAPSGPHENSFGFGGAVAIDGDVIVIGEKGFTANTKAFLFEKPIDGWKNMQQTAILTPHSEVQALMFSQSISIYENTIAIGDPLATYGDHRTGVVHLYDKPETGWEDMSASYVQSPTLEVYGDSNYDFGWSVKLQKDFMAVGFPSYIVGDATEGGIFVFTKEGENWSSGTQSAILSGSDHPYGLGYNLSVGDNFIVSSSSTTTIWVDEVAEYTDLQCYIFQVPDGGWTNQTETVKITPNTDDNTGYINPQVHAASGVFFFGIHSKYAGIEFSGEVQVFKRSDLTSWTEGHSTWTISCPDNELTDTFGYWLAGDDTHLFVSNANDRSAGFSGSVFAFDDYTNDNLSYEKLGSAQLGAHFKLMGVVSDISGNVAVVGVPRDDASARNSGAVYIFEKKDGSWQKAQKIIGPEGREYDNFGNAVSIYGNVLVVGAPGEDNNGLSSGAIYIYEKDKEDSWSDPLESIKLIPENNEVKDYFGNTIDNHKGTIVVGGISGSTSEQVGKVFVIEKRDGMYQVVGQLSTADTKPRWFGQQVSVFENTIAVTSTWGNVNDIYLYEKGEEGWTDQLQEAAINHEYGGIGFNKQAKYAVELTDSSFFFANYAPNIKGYLNGIVTRQAIDEIFEEHLAYDVFSASEANRYEGFGYDIDVSANHLVVGNYGDSIGLEKTGKVYLFDQNASEENNQEITQLSASKPQDGAYFGESVAISGKNLLVGAPGEDIDNGDDAGAAYFFEQDVNGVQDVDCTNQSELIIGDQIYITVVFDEDIEVEGKPELILTSIGSEVYISRYSSHTNNEITMAYEIQEGDAFANLEYHNERSMMYQGSIFGSDLTLANRVLPPVGVIESLTDKCEYDIDAIRPEMTLTTDHPVYTNVSAFNFNATASEALQTLDEQGFEIINGRMSSIVQDGLSYTGTVTILEEGTFQMWSPEKHVYDVYGNYGLKSNIIEIVYDKTVPTLEIVSEEVGFTNKSITEITFTFSEYVENISEDVFEVDGAQLTDFTKVDDRNYTGNLNITEEGEVMVSVDQESYQDLAGNFNSAYSWAIYFDNTPPAITVEHEYGAPTKEKNLSMILTTTEEVKGFEASDITCHQCSVLELTPQDKTTYVLAIRVDENYQGSISLEIESNSFTDLAGNSIAYFKSEELIIDKDPTVALISNFGTFTNSSAVKIQVEVNEWISGLDETDFTLDNCEIQKFSSSEGSSPLYVDLLVESEGEFSIVLNENTVADADGNTNSLESNELNLVYDITPPEFEGWSSSTSGTGNGNYKLWFSEPVIFQGVNFISSPDLTVMSIETLANNTYLLTTDIHMPSAVLTLEKEMITDSATNQLSINTILAAKDVVKASDDLIIYPNPVNDQLHINKLDSEKVRYKIFELTGSEVLNGILIQGSNTLHLDFLKGNTTYLIKIEKGHKSEMFKFFKN